LLLGRFVGLLQRGQLLFALGGFGAQRNGYALSDPIL
jgi:hypothetical protein